LIFGGFVIADKIALKTLGQSRARHAWDSVKAIKRGHVNTGGEYRSLARSAGAMILTNGLGQLLAFLKSKARGETDVRPLITLAANSRMETQEAVCLWNLQLCC